MPSYIITHELTPDLETAMPFPDEESAKKAFKKLVPWILKAFSLESR